MTIEYIGNETYKLHLGFKTIELTQSEIEEIFSNQHKFSFIPNTEIELLDIAYKCSIENQDLFFPIYDFLEEEEAYSLIEDLEKNTEILAENITTKIYNKIYKGI